MAKKKHKDAGPTEIDLPITPMLDMAFQIFAFFVFTYNPSSVVEAQMEMTLPQTDSAKAATEAQAQPTETDTELPIPADLTIVIKTPAEDSAGAPSEYIVERAEGSTPPMTTLDELEQYLVKAKKDLKNTEDITIKADGGLKYDFVVQVMDVCTNPTKGGFKRVGFGMGKAKPK